MQKDPKPKKHPNIWKKEESKEKNKLWRWKKEVCIVKNMMAIAQNSELDSNGYLNIIHFKEKVHMLNIF